MRIILEDVADVSYEYPKTTFFVSDDSDLNTIIDAKRKAKGYPTFFDVNDPDMWDDGWYNFYAEIDLENMKCTDFYATVVANNSDIPDDGWKYYVNVDYEDVFRQIKDQEDLETARAYALLEEDL